MVDFYGKDDLERELDEVSKVEDVEAGAHQAPLNNVTDAGFELLLWEIFSKQKQPKEYYDKATLMVAGADQGRDIWLTLDGKPAGLIQCKRVKSAFSVPEAIREVIKFILFAELFPELINDNLPFKYILAVSTDPTKTTLDLFTSPDQWLLKNDTKILGFLNEVIEKYESFKGFTAVEKLVLVKRRLQSFSYELVRPADIDSLLNDLPRVRARFFKIRLVQSEESIDEFMGRLADKHGYGFGQQIGEKARALLDVQLQSEIVGLRKSRFLPGGDVAKSALKMFRQLTTGEFSQASDHVRSSALGACARWLSRSDEKVAAKDALEASEALGNSEDAEIAKAFLVGNADWKESLRALAPLENPAKITAALLTAKHGTDPRQALQWFRDAGFKSSEIDADGKAVLLNCLLETQDWDAAHSLVIDLSEIDLDDSPILYYLAGMARILSVMPEEFRDAFRTSVPFSRRQFPLWDDPKSSKERKVASSLFRHARDAAAEFGLVGQHRYESLSLWLELHDPDAGGAAALKRLTSLLDDSETAVYYLPLGLGFDLKIDRERVEQVLSRQEARNPGGSFEIALARFVMANSLGDPATALTYFEAHRDLIEMHLNQGAVLEFEVQACVQAGRIEPARDAIEKHSKELSQKQKNRFELIVLQGQAGPGLSDLEVAYTENPSTINLAILVDLLGQQGFSDRFFELARKLVAETRSRSKTERVVGFLIANGRYDEAGVILSEASALIQTSLELRSASAWVQYRNGDFIIALKEVVQLRKERSEPNDRYLHQNLLIASGRWEELASFVEEEWQCREDRSPNELHALAQLSGAIRSPRLMGLLEAAAKAGGDNPDILLGCYMTATESGMEDGPEVFGWLENASKLSDSEGPVQTKSIEEFAKEMPDWNKHVSEVWEIYRRGEMPLSMVASQLRRSSLEMQVSSIVLNKTQADPRKRSVVSAFSGIRGEASANVQRIGLESTALVTLASLNILDEVIQHYDEIHIPHSTLSWLFSERRKLAFHQPSRVKSARTLLTALTTRKVNEYNSSLAPDAELATLVDVELAEMLTSAKVDDSEAQTIVVRSAPVHRVGSLMDETVDLSGYKTCLCSCLAVIDKLADLGLLVPEDERHARIYLARHEQRWSDEPEINSEVTLLLDDLSVSYFQTINVLNKLSDAGFKVFVPKSAILAANALVEMDEKAEEFERIIEGMRKSLCDGMSQGKVLVDKVFSEDDLKDHPNLAILQLAGKVDGVVADDRGLNQYRHLGGDGTYTTILTSLDILDAMNQKGVISDQKLTDFRTNLRRAGYVLFPTCQEELRQFFEDAKVRNATLIETANLKAFRENLLLSQMRGWLVLTKEIAWFSKLQKDLISVLVLQWRPEISDDDARIRSRWIFQLLDIRNWAGSITENDGSGLAQSGLGIICNSLALRHFEIENPDAAERYSQWLKEEVFDVLQSSDPVTYDWLIKALEKMLLSRVDAVGECLG